MTSAITVSFAAVVVLGSLGLPTMTPVRLQSGTNTITNIAGDGAPGSISVDWRDNGDAWGYDIYTIRAGGSVATVENADRFTDSPHTGEDVIKSVRFARAAYAGRMTLFALVANREIVESVPRPALTNVKVFALVRNREGVGTPYEFKLVKQLSAKRLYCNADTALNSELGFPLAKTYSGRHTIDGC